MDPPGVLPVLPQWFVAFVDYGRNLWWHRFTKRGFRHVFAFGYEPRLDVWIVFDPTLEGFTLRAVPGAAIDSLVAEVWARDGKILRCRVEAKAPRRPRLFATCVTVLAHLLGLPVSAVRPYGLYRMLLARGAQPAFERANATSDDGLRHECTRRG